MVRTFFAFKVRLICTFWDTTACVPKEEIGTSAFGDT